MLFKLARWRRLGLAGLVLLVMTAAWLPAHSVRAQTPQPDLYTFGECSRADAATIEAEMAALTRAGLQEGRTGIALETVVAQNWGELEADAAFDAAVDRAIARIQAEESYWARLWSGWSADAAETMAHQVAAYAFADPALTATLNALADAIAQDLVSELQAYAAQSASSALLCLQSYVGERYASALFTAFQQQIQQEFTAELDLSEAAAVQIAPLDLHMKGLTGIGVLVATEITRRLGVVLAEKIATRLAGRIVVRVLGRLGSSAIPYIGWAVGVGLVVWDLWEGSQGALPAIREAMQAEAVKQDVRGEITLAVGEALDAEIAGLSGMIALDLVSRWQGFCTEHGAVCDLAATNPNFRTLLNDSRLTDLARVTSLVDFYLQTFDAATLDGALADGRFVRLLLMPQAADAILTWSASPEVTLAWVDLAGSPLVGDPLSDDDLSGDQLTHVVSSELYRVIDPLALDQLSLAALLAIGDNTLIHKLVLLAHADLSTLLHLPTADLQTLAATATVAELTWLAHYLAELPAADATAVSGQVARGEVTIAALQAPVLPTAPAPVGANVPVAQTEVPPPAVVPALLAPWDNGVVVAAGLMLVLVVVAGVLLARRRERDALADDLPDHAPNAAPPATKER
jgi:hypothetical protein